MKFIVTKTGYDEAEVHLHPDSKKKIQRIALVAYYGLCGAVGVYWLRTSKDKKEPQIED